MSPSRIHMRQDGKAETADEYLPLEYDVHEVKRAFSKTAQFVIE